MTQAAALIVTTTRAAWLLDPESGVAKAIDQGRGVYYGVTFSEDTVYIACRQAEVGADREPQDNPILCFDRGLRPIGTLRSPWPIRDVHQIAYHAGTLFICSTYDDAVICHEPASGSWSRWHPFGPSAMRDQHHINSVTVGPWGILLAGNRPAGWFARFGPAREAVQEAPRPLGLGTHNVWLEQGTAMVCSSDEGAIVAEDGRTRAVVDQGWLRGFASDGPSRFVGVSQNRVRDSRARSDCMLLRLDTAGSITRTYAFHGYGMLHDVRLVGRVDEAHNGLALTLEPGSFARLPGQYLTGDLPISLLPLVLDQVDDAENR